MIRTSMICLAFFVTILCSGEARSLDSCANLPASIQVLAKHSKCGNVPTVILKRTWKNSFSAAFRWDDGSAEGQDRSPFALDDSSASSSPYKSQRRIRTQKADYLCFGKFLNRTGYPVPEQLTIKRTAAPKVTRFCTEF